MATAPRPHDDGACQHLCGARLPAIALPSTDGDRIDLSGIAGRVVLYVYPRTSRPGEASLEGWDSIPGARGCTPQSCAFRDHFADLRSLDVADVYGLSTQDTAYQREMVERLHLPFPVLSDAGLKLTAALQLPTFTAAGLVLLKRVTFIVDDGVISHVFDPVFPPERNAEEVLAWLRSEASVADTQDIL
jgi:peroxiredoxin